MVFGFFGHETINHEARLDLETILDHGAFSVNGDDIALGLLGNGWDLDLSVFF